MTRRVSSPILRRSWSRRRANNAPLILRMILSEKSATFQDHAEGREASLVGRPDFKSGKARKPVLGGFDSHSLPPTIVTLFGTKVDDIWSKTQAGSLLV